MIIRKLLFIGLALLLILSPLVSCDLLKSAKFKTVPRPSPFPPEIDQFPQSVAKVAIMTRTGQQLIVELTGPTIVHVFFEGKSEGEARDDDGNGLDEVQTEIVELDLTGICPLGKVVVRQNPDIPSIGVIEETVNKTPGILDLPPFTNDGSATSWFDVYFEMEVGEFVFRTTKPKRMQTIIWHKPPLKGATYENIEWIPLVDLYGQPTGFSVGPATHIPDPILEYGLSIECWPQCTPTATGATLYFELLVRDLTNGQSPIVGVAIYIDGAPAFSSGPISEIAFPPTPGVIFRRDDVSLGPHTIRIVAVNTHGQGHEQTWQVYCGGEPTDQPPDYQPPTPGPICPDCGNPVDQCTCQ